MAANDGFEHYYTEKIWALIPEVYKTEDGNQPQRDVLRSIVEVIATQAAVTRRSIDRLWEDQHVETSDDWAVPYIGDLVGTRPLAETDPRARRVDVARTIFFRRRRGTPILLETMVRELSSWDVVLVEAFRRLARTFHRLDRVPVRVGRFTKTPQGGTADLRNPRASELQPGPFDEFFHTADVRKLRGLLGWFNIRKLNFHLYRLEVFEIEGADPYQLQDLGVTTAFTFDPSGRDIPLFSRGSVVQTNTEVGPVVTLDQNGNPFPLSLNDPRSQVSDCGPPDEWDVRKPIPCRLLGNARYLVSADAVGSIVADAGLSSPSDDVTIHALEAIAGILFTDEGALRARLVALGVTFSTMPVWYPELLDKSITVDSGKKNLYPSSVAVQMDATQDIVPIEAVASADLSHRDCVNTPANPAITTLIDPKIGRFAPLAPASAQVVSTASLALPMTLTASSGVAMASVGPSDVSVFGDSTDATPSVDIGTDVTIFRDATTIRKRGVVANASTQLVHLSARANTGDIWSVGGIALDVGAHVEGTARTSGAISAGPGQIAGGRIVSAGIVPRRTVIGAVLPDSPTPALSNWTTPHAPDPGSAGKLTMSSGTLTLKPGIYTFEQLTLTSMSKLDLDPSTRGNVYVYIRKQLIYMSDTGNFDASRIRFVVFEGDASVGGDWDSPARGTVVAMSGAITVENERACEGAFFGKTVTMGPNTSIRHVAFAAWESST